MSNENIKQDFENEIQKIEEKDQSKNMFFQSIMNITFVLLFIGVLVGTILSYHNYKEVKNKLNSQETNVIEFKK